MQSMVVGCCSDVLLLLLFGAPCCCRRLWFVDFVPHLHATRGMICLGSWVLGATILLSIARSTVASERHLHSEPHLHTN
uniref:Uncharacterized protein n=1 Tax=Anopheles darlingi TaxID=43151 RepID=A0A2M4DK86_ANODA